MPICVILPPFDGFVVRHNSSTATIAITTASVSDRSILGFLRELNLNCTYTSVVTMDTSQAKATPMAPSKRKMLDSHATDDDDDITVNSSMAPITITQPIQNNGTSASLFNDSDSDDLCIIPSNTSNTSSNININDTAPSKAATAKRRKTTKSPSPRANSTPNASVACSAMQVPAAPKKAPAKPCIKATSTTSPDAKGHELKLDDGASDATTATPSVKAAGSTKAAEVAKSSRKSTPPVSPFKKFKPSAAKAKPEKKQFSAAAASAIAQGGEHQAKAVEMISAALATMLDAYGKTSQGYLDLAKAQAESQNLISLQVRDEIAKAFAGTMQSAVANLSNVSEQVMRSLEKFGQAKFEAEQQFENNLKVSKKMQDIYFAYSELLEKKEEAEE